MIAYVVASEAPPETRRGGAGGASRWGGGRRARVGCGIRLPYSCSNGGSQTDLRYDRKRGARLGEVPCAAGQLEEQKVVWVVSIDVEQLEDPIDSIGDRIAMQIE